MIKLKLYLLILFSNTDQIDKIKSIYLLENSVYESKTTCTIICYETGWMQAYKLKKDNAQKYNNLLGFYHKKKYLKFNSYSESIIYYKKWQERHWIKYHKKYPNKNYYDFLKYIGYCNKMSSYIKTIKRLENEI